MNFNNESDSVGILPSIGEIIRVNYPSANSNGVTLESYVEYRVITVTQDIIHLEYSSTEWHTEDGRNFSFGKLAELPRYIEIPHNGTIRHSDIQLSIREQERKCVLVNNGRRKTTRLDGLSRSMKNRVRRLL